MCYLCDTFGTKKITDDNLLRKAMSNIKVDLVGNKMFDNDHLVKLVDAWMGMPPELSSDDLESAEEWELNRR